MTPFRRAALVAEGPLAVFGFSLLAALVMQALRLSEQAAFVLAYIGGVGLSLGGLVAMARRGSHAIVFCCGGVACFAIALTLRDDLVRVALINAALLSFAHGVGGAIGVRVQHPSHLLLACVVAASTDALSLLLPHGPTHLIASKARVLSMLSVAFPLDGASVSPVIGIGDLLFSSLFLNAARTHALRFGRVAALIAAGLLCAGALSALFKAPIPALVPVALCLMVGLREMRRGLTRH